MSSSSSSSSSSSENEESDNEQESKHEETQDSPHDLETEEPTKPKIKKWGPKETQQLVRGILGQTNGTDMMPFTKFEVDWESIETVFSIPECKKKWEVLLAKTRHYRTMQEMAHDILLRHETVDPMEMEWNKKLLPVAPKPQTITKKAAKSNKYPSKYPKKPKNGYNLFTMEQMLKLRQEGVESKIIFSQIAERWRNLDARQRKHYYDESNKYKVQYVEELEAYAKQNPNDELLLQILKTEKAILAKKKLGGASMDDSDNHTITEYMVPGSESNSQEKVADSEDSDTEDPTLMDSALESLPVLTALKKKTKKEAPSPIKSPTKSPSKKRKEEDDIVQTPSKKRKDQDDTLFSSPEGSAKKRKTADNISSTPVKSPKKKKKEKEFPKKCTGVMMFIEAKKETYQLSHPDMDEETLWEKLSSKFEKLPQKKKTKYQTLAEERNENG